MILYRQMKQKKKRYTLGVHWMKFLFLFFSKRISDRSVYTTSDINTSGLDLTYRQGDTVHWTEQSPRGGGEFGSISRSFNDNLFTRRHLKTKWERYDKEILGNLFFLFLFSVEWVGVVLCWTASAGGTNCVYKSEINRERRRQIDFPSNLVNKSVMTQLLKTVTLRFLS